MSLLGVRNRLVILNLSVIDKLFRFTHIHYVEIICYAIVMFWKKKNNIVIFCWPRSFGIIKMNESQVINNIYIYMLIKIKLFVKL